ncbi:MAG: DNA polymerase III subunit epsilon, partial [Ginsengibacter sp.]
KTTRQKQEFLKKIYNISYKATATELMAFILESVEIKKLWPQQNRSQKRFEQTYALYSFEDRNGFTRLAIEKKSKNLPPLYTFNLLVEGHNLLRKLCEQFQLCPRLCYLQSSSVTCSAIVQDKCLGACEHKELPALYNKRVQQCLDYLNRELPTFALVDNGINYPEQSCILMEKGRFYGMGYLPGDCSVNTIEELKNYLTPYSENDYIRGLVYEYAAKFPNKKRSVSVDKFSQ